MVTGFDIIGSDKNLQEHWIKRFAAYFIDIIIIALVLWLIFFVFFGYQRWIETGLVSGVVMILYFTVFEASASTTIGKSIMGLEVTSSLGYMDVTKALIRNVTKFFWFILPFLDWVIGMATEGDPRQRFMDRVAETTVIQEHETAPKGYGKQPVPGNPPGAPTEKCHYCGAPMTEIEGARFQCTSCGIIQ
jgi:uncharacterized RDD family membrane protein YckC